MCRDFLVLIIIDGGRENSFICFSCSSKESSSLSTNCALILVIASSSWPPKLTTKKIPRSWALCCLSVSSIEENFPHSTESFCPANTPRFLSSKTRRHTLSSGLNRLFKISCAVISISAVLLYVSHRFPQLLCFGNLLPDSFRSRDVTKAPHLIAYREER